MGYWKDRLIEQDEAGFSYVGFEEVCAGCIKDEALAAWVSENGTPGECSFCRTPGIVVGISDLFGEMGRSIQREFTPYSVSTEVPPREWDIAPPTIDSADLLSLLGDPLGVDVGPLAHLFVDSFTEEWVPEGTWAGTPEDWLNWGWDRFADAVKTSRRFTFRAPPESDLEWSTDIDPSEMLTRLRDAIQRTGLVIPFPAGQPLVRGRTHRPEEELDGPVDLGPPPPSKAVNQRMSPPGISFFYAATNVATALAELRGLDGEVATIANWLTVRDQYIVDFGLLPPVPSIFDHQAAALRHEIRFLDRFVSEIAKPMRAHDIPEVDYVPTQVVAEFIRHHVTSPLGDTVGGIRYQSAAIASGLNVVLFADPHVLAGDEAPLAIDGPPRRFEATRVETTWKDR